MNTDEVRAALDHLRADTLMTYPHDVIARFADAVLNPPPDVAEAMNRVNKCGENLGNSFVHDRNEIVRWVMALTTPAAKETT